MFITDFLVVNCLLAFNGVLSRPLLQVVKVVTLIHCLTMKFPIVAGTSEV